MATIDDILARVNTEIRDSADKAFSSDEKTEAITRAIEDEYVYAIVEDESITTVQGQPTYDLDDSYKAVFSVGIDRLGDGYYAPIPGDAWMVTGSTLRFNRRYMNLEGGKTLLVTAAQKLTVNDDIPDNLVSYVINLAISYCAEFLSNIKANRFLKNDTTMAELVGRINLAEARAQRLRRQLRNQRGVSS